MRPERIANVSRISDFLLSGGMLQGCDCGSRTVGVGQGLEAGVGATVRLVGCRISSHIVGRLARISCHDYLMHVPSQAAVVTSTEVPF
jgi:hypothetical protein